MEKKGAAMSEGIAVQEQREGVAPSCRHRWIIETPNGATSRGSCKRCGASRRFPNAADDIFLHSGGSAMGRWSGNRRSARSATTGLQESDNDAF